MSTSVILTATPKNSIGMTIPGVSATWSNSDPTVASLTPISPTECRIDALSAGTTDVIATVGGVDSPADTITVS